MVSAGKIAERESQGAASFRLQCWGDFAISDLHGEADVKPRGRKARALLAYLAMHPGKPVSRERLAGLLWGGRGEEQARASLRQGLLELRPLANGRAAIVIERDHVILNPGALRRDLDELALAAERGDYSALLESLPDSHERFFGNLDGIDEAFDDWLTIERTRQRDALLTLIADASATALAHGQTRHARALHARQRELDPAAPRPPVQPPGAEAAEPLQQPKPEEQERPASAEPRPLPTRRRGRAAALAALLLTIALLAIGGWQLRRGEPAPPATIAVLPFEDLSNRGDVSFAEGLSEEITAQLAREPGLRVAGRTSSRQFKNRAADLDEVGRKLGVSYILEGSVRTAAGRVRVNVALAQASDGLQLWTQSFEGTLDDVLAIQHQIGANVAGALGRKLAQARPDGAPATSGAVYTLYLSARSLIRERNPRAMIAAGELLKRALALDPRFAPAWSSMAQVKRWEGNKSGAAGQKAREEARAFARRALALAPDLAEAHGVLGMILGFDDPVGREHIRRAAALDPTNAEFQFWLGHTYSNEPNFPAMLEAYRRAFALDPLWNRAQDSAAYAAWRMGHRHEAIGYVRRVEREGSRHEAHMLRGFLALTGGDLSEAARQFEAARAATGDLGKQAMAVLNRAGILFQLGMIEEARAEWASCRRVWAKGQKRPLEMPAQHAAHLALRQGKRPTAAELASADKSGDPHAGELVAAMAKQLIRAGHARDVAALYDSQGLLGLSPLRPRPESLHAALRDAPIVAAALRAVGRAPEADRLLRSADRMIEEALRRSRGQAPADFYAEAAQTWSLLGRHEAALAGLERARRNGWINADFNAGDLVDDIGGEPAFAGLRGTPRFETIRAAMNADLDRERREAARDSSAKRRGNR